MIKMIVRRVVDLMGILLLCGSQSYAAGDIEKGKQLYQKCAACHGTDGYGKKSQNAPMIAGQYDWYLVAQITKIKIQERKNANANKMYPFVKNLTEEEIEHLAAYIQSLAKK